MRVARTAAGASAGGNQRCAGLISRAIERACLCGDLFWRRHLLHQRFITRRIHEYRLILDGDDPGISRQLLRYGAREPEQKFILESELGPGMSVFDLGANIGYYTVMMAKSVGAAGVVYAVEPIAENFGLLEANIRINALENVRLENVAIAEAQGHERIMLTTHSNWHSFHRPQLDRPEIWLRKYRRRTVGSRCVATRSLSGYLAGKPPIHLMRMDIEGYEVTILNLVLKLPHPPSRILLETHPEFYSSANDMRSSLQLLCRNAGYSVKYLVSDYQFGSKKYSHIEPGVRIFQRRGYDANHIVRQFRNRAVYAGVDITDAIDLICESECVNAALLSRD